MSGSPHSSLSTPVQPPRAPPSPLEPVASSLGSLNPNAGDFVPTFSAQHGEPPSSPASSVLSSPGSSSTSTSVSFTLAPLSHSVSSFASFSSTPSLSELTPSTTQSSLSSYHSPLGSPNQTPHGIKRTDPIEQSESNANLSDSDVGRRLLRSLRIASPSTAAASTTVIEPGEIRSSPPISHHSSHEASVLHKPAYEPLPDIEIHKAAPTSFMSHPADMARSATPAMSEDTHDSAHKTPNVYINGLPPNFPEDQLFELAAPFGEVKSVRSFTRHVGEKESGYGFVLFETVDSAEKCIQSLRRFRNLHPTFSKVHKIPGTSFAHSSAASSHSDSSYGHGTIQDDDGSFKAKMERLHDPNSTNLYIEGLPLSIDEPSLSALVAPHRIKSSRFFQTRLSNPPRIIAFVRLDSRTGAEDVIERLHGRMVRGWNDPGSRISVRFADTSEQRELRRTERTTKEGDKSPARLTIAQAALLNLHGRDQYRPSSQDPSPIGAGRTPPRIDYSPHNIIRDFSSNAAQYHNTDIVLPTGHNGFSSAQHSASYNNRHGFNEHTQAPNNQELSPAVIALLNSLRGNNSYKDENYATARPRGGLTQAQVQLLNMGGNFGGADLDIHDQHPVIGDGASQARNGFTATEEFILQAHAASNGSQRRRPTRLDISQAQAMSHSLDQTDFNVGVRGVRTQASAVSLLHLQSRKDAYHSPRMGSGSLPSLQEEYQPAASNALRGQVYGGGSVPSSNVNGGTRSSGDREAGQIHSHGSFPVQTTSRVSSQPSSNRQQHTNQAHVRSSTLPPHSTSASTDQASRHYHHSSMNLPKARNMTSDIMRATQRAQHRSNNSIGSSGDGHTYTENKYPSDGMSRHHSTNNNQKDGEKHAYDVYSHTVFPEPDRDLYDVEQSSPPLVSPALTYSSRGSAATLSPATPFIGSFSHTQGVTTDSA